jgi:hypothetical protein
MSLPRSSISEKPIQRSSRPSTWRNPDCLNVMILPEIKEEEESNSFSSQLSIPNRREAIPSRSARKSGRKSMTDSQENVKLLMNEFDDFEGENEEPYQHIYSAPMFEIRTARFFDSEESRSFDNLPWKKDILMADPVENFIENQQIKPKNFSDRFMTPSVSHFNQNRSSEVKTLLFSTQSEKRFGSLEDRVHFKSQEACSDINFYEEMARKSRVNYASLLDPVKIPQSDEVPLAIEKLAKAKQAIKEMTEKFENLKKTTEEFLHQRKENSEKIAFCFNLIEEFKKIDLNPGKDLRQFLLKMHFEMFPLKSFKHLPDDQRWRRILIIRDKGEEYEVRNHGNIIEYPRSRHLTVAKELNSGRIEITLFDPFKHPDLQSTWNHFQDFLIPFTSNHQSEAKFKFISQSWVNFLKFSADLRYFFEKKKYSLTPSKDSVFFQSEFKSFSLTVNITFSSIITGNFELFPEDQIDSIGK